MNDPYVTLGVARTASDEEVKKAYRELARKYHPDNYANNPLADLAQEKMKEINEAYDAIEKERASGSSGVQYQTYSGPNYSGTAGPGYSGTTGSTSGPYRDAREAINAGDLSRAEMILGSITDRGAEWNYLMGQLAFRRGWMDEASHYFRMAATMDPTNPDYRQAVAYMENAARQPFTVNVQNRSDTDMCCTAMSHLLVADCCCECMGGDLIPCC